MKRFLLFTFYFLLFTFYSKGQTNLVPNPSFENYTTCPYNPTEITDAIPWISPTGGTPDYFNACSTYPDNSVPNNISGFQNAHSGQAYGGIGVYVPDFSNYREYVQVQLIQNLVKGKKYCVSFFLSLTDSSNYGTKDVGVFFSTKAITSANVFYLNYTPQIINHSNITNKITWTNVSGSFIADSTYSYITIGNFEDDSQCNPVWVGGVSDSSFYGGAYYYIDDVSVIECDDTIATDVIQIPNVITPNGDGKNDYFLIENLPQNAELKIFNRWGNTVYHSLNYQNNWEAADVVSGTYYYLLTLPDKKVKKGFLEVIK